MPRKKHTAANGLFWRSAIPAKMKEKAEKKDIDDFINTQLYFLWVSFLSYCVSSFSLIFKRTYAPIITFLPCRPVFYHQDIFNYKHQSPLAPETDSTNCNSFFSFFLLFLFYRFHFHFLLLQYQQLLLDSKKRKKTSRFV